MKSNDKPQATPVAPPGPNEGELASNAAYDQAIDQGHTEEEAEAISNEVYDAIESKEETK